LAILMLSKTQQISATNCWYYPQLPIHRHRTCECNNTITAFLKLAFGRAWKHVGHLYSSDCTVTAVWRQLTARWHCRVNIGKVVTVREQLYGDFSA
jgi:hypothetical protein